MAEQLTLDLTPAPTCSRCRKAPATTISTGLMTNGVPRPSCQRCADDHARMRARADARGH